MQTRRNVHAYTFACETRYERASYVIIRPVREIFPRRPDRGRFALDSTFRIRRGTVPAGAKRDVRVGTSARCRRRRRDGGARRTFRFRTRTRRLRARDCRGAGLRRGVFFRPEARALPRVVPSLRFGVLTMLVYGHKESVRKIRRRFPVRLKKEKH